MTNVVVFGKPRAFESYEYFFGEQGSLSAENTHREPLFKPTQYGQRILHYFVKDNFAGLECYIRANGIESAREGIIFGFAIKATSDFNIRETFSKVLLPFFNEFQNALLDENYKFREVSILDSLKNTRWSDEEIHTIQSIALHLPVKQPQKKVLLLVAPNGEDLEPHIKDYEDAYITTDSKVFEKATGNDWNLVLESAGKQIYSISNGELVPLKKNRDSNPSPEGQGKRPVSGPTSGWGDPTNSTKPYDPNKDRVDGSGGESIQAPPIDPPKKKKNKKWGGSVAIILICVGIVVASIFILGSEDEKAVKQPDPDPRPVPDPVEPSFSNTNTVVRLEPCAKAIKKSWMLNPRIEPENSPYVVSDIDSVLSESGLICIEKIERKDKTEYQLKVIRRPVNETQVTVIAYIDGIEVGQQTYDIAKADTAPKPKEAPNPLLFYNGQPRTYTQFMTDLKSDLDKGNYDFVIKKCEELLDTSEYKERQELKQLLERAQAKKGIKKSKL